MEKSLKEVFEKSFQDVKEIVKDKKVKKEVELKENKIIVSYFKNKIEINLTNGKFYPEIENKEKILIFHYICGTFETKLDEIITFKSLPEGNFYFSSIYSRIYQPIIEKYGKNPDEFVEKLIEIGGERIDNYIVKLNVFPDIFFIFEIIPEDEEFPADLKILFNRRSSEIFEIEDLAIIGEIIVSKIV